MSIAAILGSQPAVGSIGTALNAWGNNQALSRAIAQSMEQLRTGIGRQDENRARSLAEALSETNRLIDWSSQERGRMIGETEAEQQRFIDWAEQQRRDQQATAAQEIERQQMFARGAGDAFGDSLGQFQNFNQRMGDASSQIADFYREFLQRKTEQEQIAQNIAPAATGPTADREAAARAEASQSVAGDAGRMANVQGFGEVMQRVSEALGGNEQLASLLQNFARGSAGAGQAEIDSQVGNFIGQNFQQGNFVNRDTVRGPQFINRDIQAQPSMLGDLFVGLSGLAGQYMQNRAPASRQLDYSLAPSGGMGGIGARVGGGIGARVGGGIGVRAPGGMVTSTNLGIR